VLCTYLWHGPALTGLHHFSQLWPLVHRAHHKSNLFLERFPKFLKISCDFLKMFHKNQQISKFWAFLKMFQKNIKYYQNILG
jgi:hypothetical protein